jgi:hypothetical protein
MPKKSFNLDKDFYNPTLIEEALKDFSSFSLEYRETTLTIDDEDPQLLFDEFSNYCIALYNEKLT